MESLGTAKIIGEREVEGEPALLTFGAAAAANTMEPLKVPGQAVVSRRAERPTGRSTHSMGKPKAREAVLASCGSACRRASPCLVSQSLLPPLVLFPSVSRKRRSGAGCCSLAWRDGRPEEESSPGGQQRSGGAARGARGGRLFGRTGSPQVEGKDGSFPPEQMTALFQKLRPFCPWDLLLPATPLALSTLPPQTQPGSPAAARPAPYSELPRLTGVLPSPRIAPFANGGRFLAFLPRRLNLSRCEKDTPPAPRCQRAGKEAQTRGMGRNNFGRKHKREFKINRLGSQEVADSGAFMGGERSAGAECGQGGSAHPPVSRCARLGAAGARTLPAFSQDELKSWSVCTQPALGFPAASTSEDGFLRALSSSRTGQGCAVPPPQPRNVRLPRKAGPRGVPAMGARCAPERDKMRMCLDAAPRVMSPSSGSLQTVPAAAGRAGEAGAAPRLPPGAGTERPADPFAAAQGGAGAPPPPPALPLSTTPEPSANRRSLREKPWRGKPRTGMGGGAAQL